MEEERRLCYVGMTRARKRLFLSWARYRRRFGGGPSEQCMASRFLKEVPAALTETLGRNNAPSEVNLAAEQFLVRESARRNTYTGKTYNSLDNIAEFFTSRQQGKNAPAPAAPPAATKVPASTPAASPPKPAARGGGNLTTGTVIHHPTYGRGTVVRREGDGEDAKLTVSFPGYGLKKLIAKYAGLKTGK
jgi:DNA helicase-2/ATP-dependent DNA helicase PcrA